MKNQLNKDFYRFKKPRTFALMIHSPTSTIKSQVLRTLKYVSFAALLSSTALVSQSNAQAFQPIYQNFAYFLDNFCTSASPCNNHPVTVTSTQPSAGVVIGSDISSSVRTAATQSGHIVGYSDGFDNNLYGSSVAKWLDSSVTGQSLHDLFNDSSSTQALSSDPKAFAAKILKIAGVTSASFPIDSESVPASAGTTNGIIYPGGGYVIWAQDIEKNLQNADFSASAATYIAIFWAGRTLLPNMKIIPVPSSYILKVGTGKNVYGNQIQGGGGASWGLNAVVNGNGNDNYLKILQLNPSNTADNIDLMSFMHSVTVNGKPLIDGFLGQQYTCVNSDPSTCSSVSSVAPPGQFGDDTIVPVDPNLPYALMSAHDNPNQLFSPPPYPKNKYTNKPETPPWSSAYNGCMPFQAGVYWSNGDSDLQTFNPKQYLTPTAASSTTMLTSSHNVISRRRNYGSFQLSVQVQGGSAGVNGSVTSTNTSISCSSKNLFGCSQSVGAYQMVTLVANPAPGRKFLYWTGTDDCKGNNPTCSLPLKADTQVGACFQ